jgi:hypothetical protein
MIRSLSAAEADDRRDDPELPARFFGTMSHLIIMA